MGRTYKPAHNRSNDPKREPNGRLSRKKADKKRRHADAMGKAERDMMGVGISARQRIFGLSARLARDQLSGSAVGRYSLMTGNGGGITRLQADAAFIWLEDKENYSKALKSPPDASAVDLNRIGGVSNGDNEAWFRRCKDRHESARLAIQEAQNALGAKSNLWAALNLIVERDEDLPHMIGDLREALNALCIHYQLVPKKKGAAA